MVEDLLKDLENVKTKTALIQYVNFPVRSKKHNPLNISLKDLDNYNFDEPINNKNIFYEVIQNQPSIHPYFDFDFDQISNHDLINSPVGAGSKSCGLGNIKSILNQLSIKWGKFSVCGYTNNEEVVDEELNIIFKENTTKTSFHVYFDDCVISRDETTKFRTKYKTLNTVKFSYDMSVYKELGSQQVVRHPMSIKADYKHDTKELIKHEEKAVICPQNKKQSNFIIQLSGNEHFKGKFKDLVNVLGEVAKAEPEKQIINNADRSRSESDNLRLSAINEMELIINDIFPADDENNTIENKENRIYTPEQIELVKNGLKDIPIHNRSGELNTFS
jgi:hypothetical protein